MQRVKEGFLHNVEKVLPLSGLAVLEIGCGDGSRSVAIARYCQSLTAVEPDENKIKQALSRKISNAVFKVESGEKLSFSDQSFDAAIFTLSLHHVPIEKMGVAIGEAVRVTRKAGHIIFLEPTEDGTFFEAEIQFNACDGDERKEKAAAYAAMIHHEKLRLVKEVADETVFRFDSTDDFIESMNPKKNKDAIKNFLESNNYILRAGRRISIFQPK